MEKRGRILLVDDNPLNLDILRKILRKDYELALAEDGEACLRLLPEFLPQLVLLDIMMPGIDGYEVCRRIKTSSMGAFIQVILVSGKGSTAERLEGYAAHADDYVVKPFDHDELVSKVRVQFRLCEAQQQLSAARDQLQRYARDLERAVSRRTLQLAATQDMVVFALAQLAECRDTDTGEHLRRMRFYAQTIARQLGRHGPYEDRIDHQFLEDLYRSSPLHDVGKVAVPDAILLKPSNLTSAEFEKMKRHVIVGAETLERAREHVGPGTFLDMAAEIARYHHERFDGTGYCAGLKGQEIPLAARIVSVADVFDALVSRRVYKEPLAVEEARGIVLEEAGRGFDPDVVEAFERCFEAFKGLTSPDQEPLVLTPFEEEFRGLAPLPL